MELIIPVSLMCRTQRQVTVRKHWGETSIIQNPHTATLKLRCGRVEKCRPSICKWSLLLLTSAESTSAAAATVSVAAAAAASTQPSSGISTSACLRRKRRQFPSGVPSPLLLAGSCGLRHLGAGKQKKGQNLEKVIEGGCWTKGTWIVLSSLSHSHTSYVQNAFQWGVLARRRPDGRQHWTKQMKKMEPHQNFCYYY